MADSKQRKPNRFRFRAWNILHDGDNYMGSPFSIDDLAHDWTYIEIEKRVEHTPRDFVFMQSTGLADRNGVEIFEGDIISWMTAPIHTQHAENPDGDPEERRWVMRWASTQYVACFDFGSAPPAHLVSVIGNIYEHSHLLEDLEDGDD